MGTPSAGHFGGLLASSPGGLCPLGPPEKRLPACSVVTIGFSVHNDAELPGQGLVGWSLEPTL
eukprot:3465199-Alexandrium_andersonii.AAC.1